MLKVFATLIMSILGLIDFIGATYYLVQTIKDGFAGNSVYAFLDSFTFVCFLFGMYYPIKFFKEEYLDNV